MSERGWRQLQSAKQTLAVPRAWPNFDHLPAVIIRVGLALQRISHGRDQEPEHPHSLCAGRHPIFHVVREATASIPLREKPAVINAYIENHPVDAHTVQ